MSTFHTHSTDIKAPIIITSYSTIRSRDLPFANAFIKRCTPNSTITRSLNWLPLLPKVLRKGRIQKALFSTTYNFNVKYDFANSLNNSIQGKNMAIHLNNNAHHTINRNSSNGRQKKLTTVRSTCILSSNKSRNLNVKHKMRLTIDMKRKEYIFQKSKAL
jgi:hypothetical protein